MIDIPIQRFVDAIPMECPYKLQGCGAKPPRSELARHKELCTYHPDKLASQREAKLKVIEGKKKKVEQLEKEYRDKGKSKTSAKLAQDIAVALYLVFPFTWLTYWIRDRN